MNLGPAVSTGTGLRPGVVLGAGIDIATISEVRQAVTDLGDKYLQRLFTGTERSHCSRQADAVPWLATTFAVKEATIKALAADARLPWTDIEVSHGADGRAEIGLVGAAARLARQRGIDSLAVSCSRQGDQATAIVLATGASPTPAPATPAPATPAPATR